MLKVVQIQYSTVSGGSSAIRLQKAFIKAGISSSIISLQEDKPKVDNITYLGRKERIIARLDCRLELLLTKKSDKDYGLFSAPVIGNDISSMKEVREADIIYIHWVQYGFLGLSDIKKIARLKKPVIFIMHDMWGITGGCHYSFNCKNYTTGCKACPIFTATSNSSLAAMGVTKKLALYSKYDNLFFVSPSRWLYNCAKEALLTKNKPVFYIPNVLDISVYKPLDKSTAKHILKISSDESVIAFGAVSIDSKRKGWPYLQNALEMLKKDTDSGKVTILIFGSNYNREIADAIPFRTRFMGYLSDEYSTALAYNASDVFIVPSLADNQPTTVQESLSCGTAVVGFNIGGIPDMIRHKENGYLAEYKNAEDIATGIRYCLQNKIKGKMLPGFHPDLVIKKHVEMIEHIKLLKQPV